jgi:opacity protein-like surface antigen
MRKLSVLFVLFCCSCALFAQNQPTPPAPPAAPQAEFKPGGSAIGTIFFNYGYDFTDDVETRSSFSLDRAYLGYKYNFSQNLNARVIFDVGYSNGAFTAFAKNAFIEWGVAPYLKLTAGLIPIKHFELQEKAWGYRYITKPSADMHGFGTTADLGINAELPLNEHLTINLYAINGEGFKKLQDLGGNHKFGINATVKPREGLSFRVHYDIMPYEVDTSSISVFSAFAGYEKPELFRVGVEYNLLHNGSSYSTPAEEYQKYNVSAYGTYIINPAFEVFARYDWVSSNKLNQGDDRTWNFKQDGSFIMAGAQYRPVRNVNFSLNYRTFLYGNSDEDFWPDGNVTSTQGVFLSMGISW